MQVIFYSPNDLPQCCNAKYHMVVGRKSLLKGTLEEDFVFIGKLKV
jgi:hypothetical protein